MNMCEPEERNDKITCYRFMDYQEVAFNKETVQSSTFAPAYPSSNGVTGDITTFFCTKKEMGPYWYVDLGMVYPKIDRIELVNRASNGDRLRNLHVAASRNLDEGFNDIFTVPGPGKDGESIIIKCDVRNVRYVKLSLKDTDEYFHMAACRVYAYNS